MKCAALLLGLSLTSSATELFSWHTMDTRVVAQGRFQLDVHHRTRMRRELGYLDQSRVGPIARWTVNPRLTLVGGYYYQPQQLLPHEWSEGQRVFAGLESTVRQRPGSTLFVRAFAERHMLTGRPAYNRYRTSLRWTAGRSRLRPFVQNELLAVWPHFHSTRNSGGLTFRLSAVAMLDVGYLYDSRRAFWDGDRQSIVTSIRWTPQLRARR
jgi:Protein of unknown function (DUF2490)